jgi:hypothetical protein
MILDTVIVSVVLEAPIHRVPTSNGNRVVRDLDWCSSMHSFFLLMGLERIYIYRFRYAPVIKLFPSLWVMIMRRDELFVPFDAVSPYDTRVPTKVPGV